MSPVPTSSLPDQKLHLGPAGIPPRPPALIFQQMPLVVSLVHWAKRRLVDMGVTLGCRFPVAELGPGFPLRGVGEFSQLKRDTPHQSRHHICNQVCPFPLNPEQGKPTQQNTQPADNIKRMWGKKIGGGSPPWTRSSLVPSWDLLAPSQRTLLLVHHAQACTQSPERKPPVGWTKAWVHSHIPHRTSKLSSHWSLCGIGLPFPKSSGSKGSNPRL